MYGTLPKLQLHLTHHNYENSGKISFLLCYHIDMVCVCVLGGGLLEPSSDVSLLQLFLAACIASLPRLPFISTVGSTSLLTREGQRCFSQSVIKGEKKTRSHYGNCEKDLKALFL